MKIGKHIIIKSLIPTMSRENIDFLFYVCWPHYDVQTKLKNIKIQFSISIFFSPKENWHSPMWIACCKCKHITVPNLGFVSILLGIWLYFWSKSFVHKCINIPLFLFGRQKHTHFYCDGIICTVFEYTNTCHGTAKCNS